MAVSGHVAVIFLSWRDCGAPVEDALTRIDATEAGAVVVKELVLERVELHVLAHSSCRRFPGFPGFPGSPSVLGPSATETQLVPSCVQRHVSNSSPLSLFDSLSYAL